MVFQQIQYDEKSGKLMLLDNYFNYIIKLNHKSEYKKKILNNKSISIDIKENYRHISDKRLGENCYSLETCETKHNNNKLILPAIKQVNQNHDLSSICRLNSLGNDIDIEKEKIKKKLINILSKYFRCVKLNENSPNNINGNTKKGVQYINSPRKNDFTRIDRNIIIDKINKYLDEKNKKNFTEEDKNDAFNYAMKKILQYLEINEDIYISYSRKFDNGSPINNLRKKTDDSFSDPNKIKLDEKLRENTLINIYNNKKSLKKFNYFEAISKTKEKFNIFNMKENLDLSILSNESRLETENDNDYKNHQRLRIKSLKQIQKIKQKEDLRIRGFVSPIIKEFPKIFLDNSKTKIKTNGDQYVLSMELLRKGISK